MQQFGVGNFDRRRYLKLVGASGLMASLGMLNACGGQYADSEVAEELATGLFEFNAGNQAATYRNVDKFAPTRLIKRGSTVMPLLKSTFDLSRLKYEFEGKTDDIDEYMRRNRCSGILILKDGAVALERYAMGNNSSSKWTSFSVAKSMTSTLVGAALRDGSIRDLDDPVVRYLPELRATPYEQNTLRELLRMCSGVRWNEGYGLGEESDIGLLMQAVRSNTRGAVMSFMRSRGRAALPNSVFNYSTGETYILGAVVAAATGMNLSQYLSQKIWAPLGMEEDGFWLLDSDSGLEMGGNNFSACLRDYARFGQFILNQGVIGGHRVLPDNWLQIAGRPDLPVTECGALYPDYPLGYGYQWWSFPTGESAIPVHDGAFTAAGIYGQFIYVNPAQNVVAVVWSAWPVSWIDKAEMETYTLIGTAVASMM